MIAKPIDAQRVAEVLAVPLTAALGVSLLDPADPARGVVLTVGELAGNGAGGLHAAGLDAAIETAGFLAVLPTLSGDEHAVTHNTSVALIGRAAAGERVEVVGTLERRAKRIAFVTVTETSRGGPIARAQLAKSIVARG